MIAKLPEQITWILSLFHNHNKEIYLVGGCVRDMLMKRTIHDYDLTSNALPDEMIAMFQQHDCIVIPTGIQHGTITVIKDAMQVEITTYRLDKAYKNHRSPKQVAFTANIKDDLARRDFTINAMAWHPNTGLIDPYGGQEDIRKQIICCVGNAQERFHEDALRILRAIRFAFTLQFTFDRTCYHAIVSQASLLTYISKERIRDEFSKMLMSDYPNLLTILRKAHVLDYILPSINCIYDLEQMNPWHLYDVFQHTDIALNYSVSYSLCEKLAIVLHDLGKASTKLIDETGVAHFHGHAKVSEQMAIESLKTLAFDHKTVDMVATLIQYHDYYVVPKRKVLRRFLAHIQMDFSIAYAILRVQSADDHAKNMEKAQQKLINIKSCVQELQKMEQENDIIMMKDLQVNGHDMLSIGYQGREIGHILEYLYAKVVDDPSCNTYAYLMQVAITEHAKTGNH